MSELTFEEEKKKFFDFIEKQKTDGIKSRLLTDPVGLIILAQQMQSSPELLTYLQAIAKEDNAQISMELDAMEKRHKEAREDPNWIEPAPEDDCYQLGRPTANAPLTVDDLYEKEETLDSAGNVVSVTYHIKKKKNPKKTKIELLEESDLEPPSGLKLGRLDSDTSAEFQSSAESLRYGGTEEKMEDK